MFSLIATVSTVFAAVVYGILNFDRLVSAGSSNATQTGNPSVAASLLERASAMEGHNPREATELRQSAMAFLSVAVR